MDSFAGRVAVVTGAASGIGLAFATRFAKEGMKIVLADVESGPLAAVEAAIKAQGGSVIAVRTNVMHEEEIKRLADTAFDAWGNVHILCNNAGVSGRPWSDGVWNESMEDWNWVLGVNFSGVLHGIRHFVPRMLANGEPGHVVNTASVAGLVTGRFGAPYTIAKHGVVALSELLYKDLKRREAKVSASVLCPGWVNTNILDSARNRPDEFRSVAAESPALPPQVQAALQAVRGFIKDGFPPEAIADLVFDAIRSDRFYVVPAQPNIEDAVSLRLEDLRLRRNPTILPLTPR